jgi:hypothetical protein
MTERPARPDVSVRPLVPSVSGLLLGTSAPRYLVFDMAIYLLFRGLGSAIGVSATSALLDTRETFHCSRLLDVANRLSPAVGGVLAQLGQVLQARGLSPDAARLGSYQIFQGLVVKQTDVLAFIDVFWAYQWLAVAGIVVVLATSRRGKRADGVQRPRAA